MKKINDISVRATLPSIIGVVTFVILAVVTGVLTHNMRNNELEDASRVARLKAEDAGTQLAEVINSAGSVIRAYSGIIGDLAGSNLIASEKKREMIMRQMEELVIKEGRLTNVWCCMEPNMLDSLDLQHAGQPGSTRTGYFAPWYARQGNAVQLMPFEDIYDKEYYRVPKQTMKEMITKPYWDTNGAQRTLTFSIAIPIINGNRFIGVVGTDFNIKDISMEVGNLDTDDGTAGKLIADDGTVVVHKDISHVGQPAEQGNREILGKIASARMFEGWYENGEVYKVYVPIRLGKDNASWYYAVDVPKEYIYSQANESAGFLVAANLVALVIITLAVNIIVRLLLKGVVDITGIIHQLSFGIIHLQINGVKGKNEMGQMNTELGRLVEGLQRTSNFAVAIGKGNLDAEFEPLSEKDVLGNSLLEMRLSLREASKEAAIRKAEEEQRNWGTTGLAKFGEILRNDNDNLEALSYNIISNLVKYMEVNQGGIFILNDENPHELFLEMKACVAYNRKKFTEARILPGEGLIGTCYLEGETIFMTDLPEDYITITSGLGDGNPRALLITPLKMNGDIYGVLEIASFKPFEPYQREFVERVSESIAATIASVRVNIRTNALLAKTKMQAEEMANVEEELRQNMEEMQATQEEMRRREAEMQQALASLQETQVAGQDKDCQMQQLYQSMLDLFSVVELSTDGYLTAINRNMLNFFGNCSEEDFVGRHFSDFIPEGEEAARKIWERVMEGRPYDNVQTVDMGESGKVTLKQKFIPLSNTDGKIQRVIILAYEVS